MKRMPSFPILKSYLQQQASYDTNSSPLREKLATIALRQESLLSWKVLPALLLLGFKTAYLQEFNGPK